MPINSILSFGIVCRSIRLFLLALYADLFNLFVWHCMPINSIISFGIVCRLIQLVNILYSFGIVCRLIQLVNFFILLALYADQFDNFFWHCMPINPIYMSLFNKVILLRKAIKCVQFQSNTILYSVKNF
jgi:hypothetical protein